MSQHPIISPRDEIINTMIDLAHLSRSQRIVVAGSDESPSSIWRSGDGDLPIRS